MLKKTSPQAGNFSGKEQRQSFRVAPPAGLVKEFALWFIPPALDQTLKLEELERPDMFSINGADSVLVENISAAGIRFSIAKSEMPPLHRLKLGHCYIYLKLRSPLPGKCALSCVFLGVTLLGASEVKGRIHLRGKVTSRGMAAKSSKSFQLFNVERVGVKELTVWCEEISRMGRGILPPPTPGLDLEYLMIEISMMQMEKSLAEAEQTNAV